MSSGAQNISPRPSLTVVAPCYNEADGILTFYELLTKVLDTTRLTYDILLVDDGSSDNTLQILNQIASQDPRVGVLAFTRNFGHQVAISAGLDYARGEMVLVMDSDLQHPPDLIPAMLQQLEDGVDIVYAVRQDTEGISPYKRLASRWFYVLLNRISNNSFIPGAADFRLMSRRAVNTLCHMRERHRFLRGMVVWTGFSARTISYHAPARMTGQSSYTWLKLCRLALHALFSFSVFPLRLVMLVGMALTGSGFLYLIYILVDMFFHGRVQPGWASLQASIMILSGVQLLSLGVIALYIGMIFEEIKQRPLYVLHQEPYE